MKGHSNFYKLETIKLILINPLGSSQVRVGFFYARTLTTATPLFMLKEQVKLQSLEAKGEGSTPQLHCLWFGRRLSEQLGYNPIFITDFGNEMQAPD